MKCFMAGYYELNDANDDTVSYTNMIFVSIWQCYCLLCFLVTNHFLKILVPLLKMCSCYQELSNITIRDSASA